MRERLSGIDRRLAIAGLVLVASSLLLVAGLVSIFATLNDDNVDLPNEGSLEQILAEHEPDPANDTLQVAEAGAPSAEQEIIQPVRISISRIGVDAPIVVMGLDAENYPEVPNSGDEVAWYTFSAPPGRGSNAVFSGHVDWYYWGNPAEGVFYNLRKLEIGDEITLDMEDGSRLRYRVTGNVAIPYEDPNAVKVMDPTSKDVITLITCGGTWERDYSNPNGGNYSQRVVVRAERILDLASDQPAGGS
jgi:LPXTG-site transpeptidase (sortase) family protein